jgi:DNA-binding CsgD family transcriptional regulator
MARRKRELVAGERFLSLLSRGPGCVVLEGEPGIGKTTVWRELVEMAEGRGYRVLSCRPAEAEAKLSFAGLADLLSTLERDVVEELPAPQRDALRVALLEAAPGPRALERRAVFAGFCSALFGLASQGPVLVAIDDLQWLDRPSQAALEFALRRLGERTIGILCAVRVRNGTGLPTALARALEESHAERVLLGPASVTALQELIVERFGDVLARPTVVRIAALAHGNPFYALEIAREVARRGEPSPGEVLPVPGDLSELVAARIRRLPAGTREQLLMAAALSNPLVRLLDEPALSAAEELGLIAISQGRVSFSHPLFASAVYASAPLSERRALHRRLASLVDEPEERARHMALGAEAASEEIAFALEGAAERARLRGAPDAAAELLELAVRLTPTDSQHGAARALSAADCHFHAGDLGRARSLATETLERPVGPAARGHALQVLGEVCYHEQSFREAVPLFERALALPEADRRAVELHVDLAYAQFNLGEWQAAAAHGRAAVAAATAVGDRGLTASALAISAIADLYLEQPLDRARLEEALALEDHDRQLIMPMRPSLIAGVIEYFSDNFERSASLYEGLRRHTIELGEESSLPLLDVNLSRIERQRGDLARALEHANEACEIAGTLHSYAIHSLALAERCYVRATLGEVPGARDDAAAARAIAAERDVGYASIWLRWATGFLELSLGDPRATANALEPLAARLEASGGCNAFTATAIPDAVEALVALGELERAQRLIGFLEHHARIHDRPSALAASARGRALVAGAHGDLTLAQEETERALKQHARVSMPLELGRTLLVKGQLARRQRQKRAARESLAGALQRFEQTGARLWSERARAELERTGLRHSEGSELTPTELRVAELAAQGLTNRRIAETVFVSVKTVEAHLAHIYRKLGIGSRAELGRAMAERAAAKK